VRIALIWAMTRDGLIGRDNDLPWRLPDDMKHFMRTTRGHPVIMGRRTFESMAGPLPRRTNIVVTRQPAYPAGKGTQVVADLDAALAAARAQCDADGVDLAFIIGGAELYRIGLAIADRLYVTQVDAEVDGDTHFPEVDWSAWRRVSAEHHPADAEHAYSFDVEVYERA
jgi:dihydrofolate reductase